MPRFFVSIPRFRRPRLKIPNIHANFFSRRDAETQRAEKQQALWVADKRVLGTEGENKMVFYNNRFSRGRLHTGFPHGLSELNYYYFSLISMGKFPATCGE